MLCENKNNPDLGCHGTCRLTSELSQDKPTKSDLPPLAEFQFQPLDNPHSAFHLYVDFTLKQTIKVYFMRAFKENTWFGMIDHPPERMG